MVSFDPRRIVRAELEMKYRRFVNHVYTRLAVIAVGSLTASIVSIVVGGPAGQILALAGWASITITGLIPSLILIPRGAKADFTLDWISSRQSTSFFAQDLGDPRSRAKKDPARPVDTCRQVHSSRR